MGAVSGGFYLLEGYEVAPKRLAKQKRLQESSYPTSK
jgi:hypothetical protein